MPSAYDEDEDEGKWDRGEGKYSEGKYDDDGGKAAEDEDEDEWVLPGMGQAEEDTLLTRTAKFCSSGSFAEEMNDFVSQHCDNWVDADRRKDSHADLGRWQSIHEEYLEFFEEKLEDFVRRQGGDLAELMADCREALQNKHGWLFEDENYAAFVNWMKSVLDYEHFHQMMVTAANSIPGSHK